MGIKIGGPGIRAVGIGEVRSPFPGVSNGNRPSTETIAVRPCGAQPTRSAPFGRTSVAKSAGTEYDRLRANELMTPIAVTTLVMAKTV